MAQRTFVAYFDRRADAQTAADALVKAGISRSAIRLLPESETSSYRRTGDYYDYQKDEGGFWASLADLFLAPQDRYAYAEGMSRGGVSMAITTDEANLKSVSDILQRNGAVNMDEREASWRREGWRGYTGAVGNGAVAAANGEVAAAATTRGPDARGEEVIPVYEERLRIDKREVPRGMVRIRASVVETPVQERITLRQSHIEVRSRPADRAIAAADQNLFRDRLIEAQEWVEEAVVSKEARIKEEIVVRRDFEEREQTVKDVVRRTKIEVDDQRPGRAATATREERASLRR